MQAKMLTVDSKPVRDVLSMPGVHAGAISVASFLLGSSWVSLLKRICVSLAETGPHCHLERDQATSVCETEEASWQRLPQGSRLYSERPSSTHKDEIA